MPGVRVTDPVACQCGEVLKGALKPHQWQRVAPLLLALLAIEGVHLRGAVIVARDFPFEAQGDQRGGLDDELARYGRVLGIESTAADCKYRQRREPRKYRHLAILCPIQQPLSRVAVAAVTL